TGVQTCALPIFTLFPEMFESPLNHSIMKRAQEKKAVSVSFSNFRRFGSGKHQHVDDTPYGGGAGMLLKPEPIFQAIGEIEEAAPETRSEERRVGKECRARRGRGK